jgi:spore maturation protein CgeB
MFMVNNVILNTLNVESFYINKLIMKTFSQLFFEKNAFIINSGLFEIKNMDWLINYIIKILILNSIPKYL